MEKKKITNALFCRSVSYNTPILFEPAYSNGTPYDSCPATETSVRLAGIATRLFGEILSRRTPVRVGDIRFVLLFALTVTYSFDRTGRSFYATRPSRNEITIKSPVRSRAFHVRILVWFRLGGNELNAAVFDRKRNAGSLKRETPFLRSLRTYNDVYRPAFAIWSKTGSPLRTSRNNVAIVPAFVPISFTTDHLQSAGRS